MLCVGVLLLCGVACCRLWLIVGVCVMVLLLHGACCSMLLVSVCVVGCCFVVCVY